MKQFEKSIAKLMNCFIIKLNCGQGWIRTTELRRGQIYSLLPLATWLLARNGAEDGSRTRDLLITNQLLLPTELLRHA
jgi:hypothetical protein